MSAKLDDVDKAIHAEFHASLSHLHANQKTRKEVRMLSEMRVTEFLKYVKWVLFRLLGLQYCL